MEYRELVSLVNYRIEASNKTIKETESHLANGFLGTAMNRIYYSGFYIISALAVIDGFSTAKHKQLIGYFNKEYIKTSKVNPEIGKIMTIAYDRRVAADYHDFVTLTKTQINEYRLKMIDFIKVIEEIIKVKLSSIAR